MRQAGDVIWPKLHSRRCSELEANPQFSGSKCPNYEAQLLIKIFLETSQAAMVSPVEQEDRFGTGESEESSCRILLWFKDKKLIPTTCKQYIGTPSPLLLKATFLFRKHGSQHWMHCLKYINAAAALGRDIDKVQARTTFQHKKGRNTKFIKINR